MPLAFGPGAELRQPIDLFPARTHHELARWYKSQFHSDAIGDFDWHAKILGPRFLMLLCLVGIEGSDGRFGGIRRKLPLGDFRVFRSVLWLRDNRLRLSPTANHATQQQQPHLL